MRTPEPPTLQDAQSVLQEQAFSRLLGASLPEFGDGRATLEIPLRSEHLQQNLLVHGGLLAYAADNSMTFAGGSVLGPHVLTAAVTIDYVAPAHGDVLRARAWVGHEGERQAVCHASVEVRRKGEWVVCAVAQGLIRSTRERSSRRT